MPPLRPGARTFKKENMTHPVKTRTVALLIPLFLLPGLSLCRAQSSETASALRPQSPAAPTNAPAAKAKPSEAEKPFIYREPLKATPEMQKEAFVVGKMLEDAHFARKPIDEKVGREMILNYLKALDVNHLIFLQSDVDQFMSLGGGIRTMFMQQNLSLAFNIYTVFQQRLQQRSEMVRLLLAEKHTFDGEDTILIDRTKAGWPRDDEEARILWRRFIKYRLLQEKLDGKKTMEQCVKDVQKSLDRYFKNVGELEAYEVVRIFINSLVRLYDPHSEYMDREMLNEFKISMKLSLFGIGAVLQSDEGKTKIVSLTPGSPADRSKQIRPGDIISGVAQGDDEFVDVTDMKLNKVVSMIRGAKDTVVRLRVVPADAVDTAQSKVVTIVRDEIKMADQEAKARLVEWSDGAGVVRKFGVIDLPMFYSSTDDDRVVSPTEHIRTLVNALKKEGVQGLILDLRRNGGGSLDEAISLTGLFIPSGPVVQVRDPQGNVKVDEDVDKELFYDGPLVVLTTHLSASASEILAAALQDYKRAVIVGDQSTFGKGTVQAVIPLGRYYPNTIIPPSDTGAFKMTVQKFYRVAGGSTQLKGVIPDIQLPSVFDTMDIAEKSMDHPLPYDVIKPARYQGLNQISPGLIAELSKKSAERLARNPDYAYIREDIELMKQRGKEKPVSLNEKVRLREKDQDKARREARKKERLARKDSKFKVLQLTVANPVPHPVPEKPPEVKPAKKSEDGEESDGEADPEIDPGLNEGYFILNDLIEAVKK
ncbi:MAG: carboxy terminal-processing peptidase [Verrucomicrobiae bacterium]|nr:carboxy terminal-processing peptidase [Verrucomicrobiae bacterium]